jgi:quinohemoprotein ethanol dehydrogenase
VVGRLRLSILLGVATAVTLVFAGAAGATPFGKAAAAVIPGSPAFSVQELNAYAADDWLTTGGGITDDRYSVLQQINRGNVASLKIAWQTRLGLSQKQITSTSEEGTPIVYQGVMYVTDGVSDVFAYNAATGDRLWAYTPGLTPSFIGVDRGAAVGDGRLYNGEVDGHVVALDQQTGKVIWSTLVGSPAEGYSFTAAPVYYQGMVIIGSSGGDVGARSFVIALDAKTGLELWRWYVAPEPGQLGGGTWPGTEWLHGGGAIWIYPSVDPVTNLVYVVTGNPVPWNGRPPGENLWTDSIVALHVENGQIAWGFQTVHHDLWDFDVTNPPVLFDAMYNGQLRHGIGVASKTAWVYLLDRETGAPLLGIPEKKVPQLKGAPGKYANTWPTQPFPVGQAFANQCSTRKAWPSKAPDGKPYKVGCIFTPYAPTHSGSFLASAPSAEGGVDWPPSAYNPETRLMYLCTRDGQGLALGAVPHKQQQLVLGKAYFGINFGSGSKVMKDFGRVVAMDVTTNTIAWNDKLPQICFSGILTTAGGLVFAGESNNGLFAYDASNGQQLWTSGDVGTGVNAPAMTYAVNGKQYIAVLAGGNVLNAYGKPGDQLIAFTLP